MLTLFDSLKVEGLFTMFGLFSLAGFVFVFALVQETKGLTLEEVQRGRERSE